MAAAEMVAAALEALAAKAEGMVDGADQVKGVD